MPAVNGELRGKNRLAHPSDKMQHWQNPLAPKATEARRAYLLVNFSFQGLRSSRQSLRLTIGHGGPLRILLAVTLTHGEFRVSIAAVIPASRKLISELRCTFLHRVPLMQRPAPSGDSPGVP